MVSDRSRRDAQRGLELRANYCVLVSDKPRSRSELFAATVLDFLRRLDDAPASTWQLANA